LIARLHIFAGSGLCDADVAAHQGIETRDEYPNARWFSGMLPFLSLFSSFKPSVPDYRAISATFGTRSKATRILIVSGYLFAGAVRVLSLANIELRYVADRRRVYCSGYSRHGFFVQ
jgi:hypothetical protein